MLSIITLFLTLVGAGVTAVTIISQAYFWQRKEYRLDRVRALLSSEEREGALSTALFVACSLLLIAWSAFFAGSWFASLFGWASLLAFTFHHLHRLYTRGFYRPVLTLKALLVIAASSVLMAGVMLSYTPAILPALQWAAYILIAPFAVAAAVGLVNLITYPRRQAVITRAQTLRRQLSTLTVIGITGSYGKTSTKYFLNQILTHAHIVHAASRHHRNSELAIAQDMLTQLSPKTNIYIAEMGAYAPGEIADLATLAQPQIGIITSIGNQHLSLFGSPENLANAKWELAQGLPSDGILVLNRDDPTVRQKAETFTGRIVWYSTLEKTNVWASNITTHPRRLDFDLSINNHQRNLAVPLLSHAPLSNILAAVSAAFALNIPPAKIFESLSRLKPMPRTMELRLNSSGQTVIDDSYSANEVGVLEAIRHIGSFPDTDKIIFLTPIIELGERAEIVHERVGQALQASQCQVFITNPQYAASIKHGFGPDPDRRLHILATPEELKVAVSQAKSAQVVLLEGRVPELVRTALLR